MQVTRTLASPPPQAGQLLRVLGLVFALAVGTVVGGGILRTPAVVFDAVPHAGIALALWMVPRPYLAKLYPWLPGWRCCWTSQC